MGACSGSNFSGVQRVRAKLIPVSSTSTSHSTVRVHNRDNPGACPFRPDISASRKQACARMSGLIDEERN